LYQNKSLNFDDCSQENPLFCYGISYDFPTKVEV
jgi:hypothetical protein